MVSSNTKDTIHLVVFNDDGGYCAIVHAPNPRLPVRFQIDRDLLRELKQAIEIVETEGLLITSTTPEEDRDAGLTQSMQNRYRVGTQNSHRRVHQSHQRYAWYVFSGCEFR